MVAAVCSWHEHHQAATAAVERRLALGERLAVPAHALAETYAVLTRLPAPHRLAPADAWTLVETNFIQSATAVALTGSSYVAVLRHAASQSVAGGRTYDALIAECARRARARVILTFNPRHFDPPPTGVIVIDPSMAEV
jgi:predicted nucleic acid-binding protein